MKSKKKRLPSRREHTPGAFWKQITVPYQVPTLPPGFGAGVAPTWPSTHNETYNDLRHIYETLFSTNDLQRVPNVDWVTALRKLSDSLLESIVNVPGTTGPKTATQSIVQEPEEPKRPSSWQDILDDIQADDDDSTRRRGIVDIIPTVTDPLDILDDLPDPSDHTGDDTSGGEPDDIHDDDEPPAPDTTIKDKFPSSNPTCEETEDYLSSIGIQASVCTRTGKETRIIGKA